MNPFGSHNSDGARPSDVRAWLWPESQGFGPVSQGFGLAISRARPKGLARAWLGPGLAWAMARGSSLHVLSLHCAVAI